MSYLEFNKQQLINLEYSLSKEVLRSNRAGSFASSTIINCNTRKYHGLLICPLEQLDGESHVLLSTLHETVIQHDTEFHLGINRYPDKYHPLGHKYVREFNTEPIPAIIYRVGGVVLKREILLAEEEDRILMKYTLLEAHSPTKLKFQPFLAFRQVHKLSKANMDVNTKFEPVKNGIKCKMYQGYPNLFMQFSRKVEYVHAPDWYYNIEYLEEKKRGYDHTEDLFVPGFFELSIKKGESIIFSAGTTETPTHTLKRKFTAQLKKRIPRNNFDSCLKNSAQQFFVKKGKRTEVIAGFPWFGRWARDTFIALPGLTLSMNDIKTYQAVLDTMSSDLHGSLFNNMGKQLSKDLDSVDAPLWFFWAVQKYTAHTKQPQKAWKNWGAKMKKILKAYKNGRVHNIKMHNNGLVFSGEKGHALTWMDAIVQQKPVTPRIGYNVEVNALWYNALQFSLELAEAAKDTKFIEEWQSVPAQTKASFHELFWNKKHNFLTDTVNADLPQDKAVRPNQIFAASMPYSMLNLEQMKAIVDVVKRELLTPRGLRSLSPKNQAYHGVCVGNVQERDTAYHQGTAWVWLLGAYAEAYLRVYEKSGLHHIEKIYNNFEPEIWNHGIGSISEIYDGNPPHEARGAISQAWSVAEILRIKQMIDGFGG